MIVQKTPAYDGNWEITEVDQTSGNETYQQNIKKNKKVDKEIMIALSLQN